MTSSEPKVIFFHISDIHSKLHCIVNTARSHFLKKETLLFFVENEKAELFLDELLWKLPEHSFLPHVIANQKVTDRIAITKTRENVNGALFAFNLCSMPLLLSGFKVIYDLEDLTAQSKQGLSSLRFNAYKQAKIAIESEPVIYRS